MRRTTTLGPLSPASVYPGERPQACVEVANRRNALNAGLGARSGALVIAIVRDAALMTSIGIVAVSQPGSLFPGS